MLADYNTLIKLYTSPMQLNEVRRKLEYLKPRLETAQKQETEEMLSKLKGLGNSILGSYLNRILNQHLDTRAYFMQGTSVC